LGEQPGWHCLTAAHPWKNVQAAEFADQSVAVTPLCRIAVGAFGAVELISLKPADLPVRS
jgi:hypothetical protein